jgi:predicted nucleic acid-binding protein
LGFLIDTNILSELRKPNADAGVRAWFGAAQAEDLSISVLTVGAIRQGIERSRVRNATRAAVYSRWLETLQRDFSDRALPVTVASTEEWGRLNARRPRPTVDSLLAATALVCRLVLVTRSAADVHRTGAQTLNPFTR